MAGVEIYAGAGFDNPPRRPERRIDRTLYFKDKGKTLKESHGKQERLKKCPDKYECMNLPKDIVDILKQDDSLKRAGFKFDKASGKLIFPEGFNNVDKIRKIRKFLEFAGWLYSPKAERLKKTNSERYKIEKFKKYIELTKLSTQIEGMSKKLLQYRYINSIYQDIIDEGFIFKKDKNGNYSLFNPKTGKEAKGTYARMLLDSKNINSFDFDFAFLSSITNNSPIYKSEKGLISQKHTISAILDKHKITDRSGNRITPVNIMLVDWEHIKTQIDDKLKHFDKTNLHSYQELMYLKGFVENKDYLSKNKNRNLYQELNAYNTAEGQVNALLGAAKGETTEKGMMEKLVGVARELAIPGIMLGLLLSIFSGTRKIGKTLLIGGIGGLVGAKVIKAIGKRVEGFSDEDLGLIIPQEIIYSVDAKNKDYSKGIKKLQELNKANLANSGFKTSGERLPTLENNKSIIDISNDILKLDEDPKIIITPDDLLAKLKVKNPNAKYTKNDIKTYLQLLSSEGFNNNDKNDKTIRDYLSEGLDINNRVYKDIYSLNIPSFDNEINKNLKEEYDKTKGNREKRKDLLKIYDAIDSISSGFKIGDINAKFVTGLNSKLSEVKALTEQYKTEFPGLWNKLNPIFENYKKYIKVENELDGFTGPWDESNIGDTAKILFKETFKLSKTQDYIDLYDKIDSKITALEKLKLTGSLANQEPFKSLNTRIDNVLRKLETSRDKVLEKLIEKGVNIQETFKKEKFDTKPGKVRDRVVEYIRDLKDFENNLSNISIGDLNDKLDDIKSKYKYLQSGLKLVNSGKLVIDTTNRAKEIAQTELINKLSINFINLDLKGTIKSKLESFYNENNTQLTKLDSIDTTSNFEDDIKALDEVEEYLSSKGNIDEVDNKTKEAKQKAEDIFGNLGLTNTTTLKNISDKYETKKTEVKTKAQSTLSNIEANINTLNDKQKIKDAYKTVKKIGELFPEFNGRVNIIERILVENLLLKDVKNFNEELRNLNLDSDKQEVIRRFLAGEIKYGNLDITNMKVKDFLNMVQGGNLKYNNVSIKIDDIRPIFENGAVFNALNNL